MSSGNFLKTVLLPGLFLLVSCSQKVETHYFDGKLKERFITTRGQRNGPYVAWNTGGQQIASGEYIKGYPMDGTFYTWYQDEQPESLSAFKDGQRHGTWQTWYKTGTLREKGVFQNDAKDSLWFALSEKGDTLYRGTYQDSKRQGPWLQLEYKDTMLVHVEAGQYNQDQPVGTWTRWKTLSRDTILAEGPYLNGLKHGPWTETRTDTLGNIKELFLGFYREGKRDSLWIVKHPRSRRNKKSMFYKAGLLHGPYKAWDWSGAIAEEGHYKNGQKHGSWTVFDALQNEYWMEEYRNGRQISRFKL
jgi:antitoxin component YwqK of YwqJK toxin-antitoxin module